MKTKISVYQLFVMPKMSIVLVGITFITTVTYCAYRDILLKSLN